PRHEPPGRIRRDFPGDLRDGEEGVRREGLHRLRGPFPDLPGSGARAAPAGVLRFGTGLVTEVHVLHPQGERMRRAPGIVSTLLILALGQASAQSGRTMLREGNGLYEKEKYVDAEVSYRKALEAEGDPLTAKFNLGGALYQQGRFEEAAG